MVRPLGDPLQCTRLERRDIDLGFGTLDLDDVELTVLGIDDLERGGLRGLSADTGLGMLDPEPVPTIGGEDEDRVELLRL